MKATVVSLGCKVNQSEGEDILAGLVAAGLDPAGRNEPADVTVVNTCTVTGEADRKSRKAIYQAVKRRAGKDSVVVVTGCYAAIAADELSGIDGVSLVVGQTEKSDVVERVIDVIARSEATRQSNGGGGHHDEIAAATDQPRKDKQRTGEARTRAYLKVQDGCDNRCAYCIVPDARGNPVSVPEEEVLRRAEQLATAGAKEIILTGINVGKYSRGYHSDEIAAATNQPRKDSKPTLESLIRKILGVPGVARARLSSIEPEDVSLELIGLLNEGLCPHLHIPLQSGDNRTLKRMGRRYVTGEFLRLVNSVRHANPDVAITTDLIVGFPGETDEEFANTMRFLEAVNPARMHVFQYSPRIGTPAAEMPDQVPPEVKALRSAEARELADRLAAEYRESFAGRELDVLVETVKDGVATGTSENYLAVSFAANGARPGHIVRVTI
jgi:threonylcarbamoyladenosine tRNA methylthiotransferase MtaB